MPPAMTGECCARDCRTKPTPALASGPIARTVRSRTKRSWRATVLSAMSTIANPKGRLMPKHIRRGNRTKAKHRAPVEHVFAGHKHMMGMAVRTIGPARAKTKSGMTNIA